MSELNQKPKRKRNPRSPYLILGVGIAIGIVIAAAVVSSLLLFVGNASSVQVLPTAVLVPTETVDSDYSFGTDNDRPTITPFVSAQGVQGTPIANRIQAATISPNGEYLAVVSVDNGISHIILTELSVETQLNGNSFDLHQASGYFNDIIFSPDGSKLIATIDSGFALLFDVETRTLIEEYPQIGGAAFTSNSDNLVLVGRNNGIRVLNINENPQILVTSLEIDQSSYTVGAVAVNRDNDLAIALDTRVEIFDLDNLASAPQVIEPQNGFVSDLAFHPTQSNRLAIALAGDNPINGVVQIFDLDNTSRSQYDFGTRVFAIAFSPDGEWLAVGGGESGYAESKLIAFRWDSSNNPIPSDPTYYQPLEFEGHEHTIFDVGFTREGYLLSAGWDGSVRLWELLSPNAELSVYYP